MGKIEKIPPEERWKIAARAAVSIPFAYDSAIRRTGNVELQNAFALIEQEIWRQAGRQQEKLAQQLGCPTGDAREVAETFITLSRLLLGPEMEGEVKRGEGDVAAIVTTSCTMNRLSRETGADLAQTCSLCREYCKAAVESLNPDYELHYAQGMCRGDAVCEMAIRERTER